MKKVILFARVSTQQQSLERQKDLLFPLIKDDGYDEDEISIVEYKESAIKNDVQSRKSIAEMENIINSESIEAVYVTEISRLGRRNDVLYYVFNLLEKKHIALIVQSPTLIRTINKDGSDNPMGQLVISFMQHLAVNEMKIKKERQKSGYERNKKEGHLTVSKVKFGYNRTNDNRPQINEYDASVVRKIFQMYLNGKSLGEIGDDVKYLTKWDIKSITQKIYAILKDSTYIGKNPHFPYPSIIDEDTFIKVAERLQIRNNKGHRTKFIYYCKKLIYLYGRTLSPCCAMHIYKVSIDNKSYSININVIDGLTKNLAIEAYSIISETDAHNKKENLIEAKETTSKKIMGIDANINSISTKLERLEDMYIEGRIDKNKYEFRYNKFKGEINYLLKEKENLNVSISSINDIVSNSDKMLAVKMYNNLDKVDDRQIVDIINEIVERIDLEKTDNGYIIRYTYKDIAYNEQVKDFYYKYIRKGGYIYLYEINDDDGTFTDFTGCWEKRI